MSVSTGEARLNNQVDVSPQRDTLEADQWGGASVKMIETSNPERYQLEIYINREEDRDRYQMTTSPKLPTKRLSNTSRSIDQYQINIESLARGSHQLRVSLAHHEGRRYTQSFTIWRRPTVHVKSDRTIHCDLMECSGQISWHGQLKLRVEPKSVVTFGEQTVRETDEEVIFNFDVLSFALTLPNLFSGRRSSRSISDIASRSLFSKTLNIALADGSDTSYVFHWDRSRLIHSVQHALQALLEREEAEGVIFPGEKISEPPRGLLIFPGALTRGVKRATDIRWVAFVEERHREEACGNYRNLKSQVSRKVMRRYTDLIVTVFDRLSGQRAVQRLFYAPSQRCPDRKVTTNRLSNSASYDELYQWVDQYTRQLK